MTVKYDRRACPNDFATTPFRSERRKGCAKWSRGDHTSSVPVVTVYTAFLWSDNSHNTFFAKICLKQTADSLNTIKCRCSWLVMSQCWYAPPLFVQNPIWLHFQVYLFIYLFIFRFKLQSILDTLIWSWPPCFLLPLKEIGLCAGFVVD